MAVPFSLIIAGVDGGADLLDLPPPSATTTPYVDLSSLTLTQAADGGGSSMSFDVIQRDTPISVGVYQPWWRSGGVNDNARVQFFDSRYHATTPIFMGYITSIEARLMANGLGTVATVSVADPTGWLDKTIVRSGRSGTNYRRVAGDYGFGTGATTDQTYINGLLAKVATQRSDASSLQILNTSIISGSTRAIYSGSAVPLGEKQSFKVGTLRSALDQIAAAASGESGNAYRYYIDTVGRLHYEPVTAAPTVATAPIEITTDTSEVRTGSVSESTRILARDLRVSLDHDRIVKGIYVACSSSWDDYDRRWSKSGGTSLRSTDPYFRTYTGTYPQTGAAKTARSGAIAHEVIDASQINTLSRLDAIGRLARATFNTRSAPVRSVTFTVAGNSQTQTSSPDWSHGYLQGWCDNGTTRVLTTAWQAGQYCKINAPALGLSAAILRIVRVVWRFEAGSYNARLEIECEQRRGGSNSLRYLLGSE
jgi:hypothetical protein